MRQSGNARIVVFLAVLVIALFIPVYWFYEIGIPALGRRGSPRSERRRPVRHRRRARLRAVPGQLRALPRRQRPGRHRAAAQRPGQALQRADRRRAARAPGHLNPNYIDTVLTVGGRYVCGDPNSLMPAWLRAQRPAQLPRGRGAHRLDHGQLATSRSSTTPRIPRVRRRRQVAAGHGAPAGATRTGSPSPGATPPPACWKNPGGVSGGSGARARRPGDPASCRAGDRRHAGAAARHRARGHRGPALHRRRRATSSRRSRSSPGETVAVRGRQHGRLRPQLLHRHDGGAVACRTATTDVGIPTWQSGVQTTDLDRLAARACSSPARCPATTAP